ncbi:hypothetical protein RR46_06737 [Papilio xuthus]|uniref:Uncharacterized protein n=1 Tax=Papilio xuthus TaxID=66420 RepID=A0A194PLH4_PAPXU|nr:hypothetical protein RR46_06737 [Papilio xuthus]
MIVQDRLEGVIPEKLNLASEEYVVIKNHVRELKNTKVKSEIQDENKDEVTEQKVLKFKNRKRKHSNSEIAEQSSKCCEINKDDLEELRTLYNKCKKVIRNIENKYGHLLNLFSEPQTTSSDLENIDGEEKCTCEQNKRIIFDDEGKQILKDVEFDRHICVKNHERNYRNSLPDVHVEYEHETLQKDAIELPDDLIDLENILKNPATENKLRRRVINKIRGLRFDYIREIRFNRQMLVEKLKSNPDELLTFSGSNLSSLSGYPT